MKKNIFSIMLLFSGFVFGKVHYKSVSDTIWYDCNYKLTNKKGATIYKLHAYRIQDHFIHVYFSRLTLKNTLISYSKDENDRILDGKRTFYFDTGIVKNVEYYKDNQKEGPYIEYYNTSKVYLQGNYKKGIKEGEFIVKDEEGKICNSEIWSNGMRVNKKLKPKLPVYKAVVDRE